MGRFFLTTILILPSSSRIFGGGISIIFFRTTGKELGAAEVDSSLKTTGSPDIFTLVFDVYRNFPFKIFYAGLATVTTTFENNPRRQVTSNVEPICYFDQILWGNYKSGHRQGAQAKYVTSAFTRLANYDSSNEY